MNIELLEPEAPAVESLPATVDQRATLALASTKTEVNLLALVEKAQAITVVNSADGREECHSQLMVLVKSRTSIVKTGEDAREDATKFSKAVIKEVARLLEITSAEETRLQALRDAWDAKIKAEKEAKAAAERARVLSITQRIADIRAYGPLALQCRTAARVQELADKLAALPMEGFEEFTDEAMAALAVTVKAVGTALAQKEADEAERARVKAEQDAEAARLKAQAEALAQQQADAQRLQDERDAEEARRRALWLEQEKELADRRAAQEIEARRLQDAAAALADALKPAPEPVAALSYAGPWCCADAKAQGVPVCASCAETSAAFQAELGPIPKMQEQQTPEPVAYETKVPLGDVFTAVQAIETVAPAPAVMDMRAQAKRPTDEAIICTLAEYYRVHESTVITWLHQMDLKAASESLLTEFHT